MRDSEARTGLRPSDLGHDDGYTARARLLECCDEARGIAHRFEEKRDHAGRRLLERKVHVVGGGA